MKQVVIATNNSHKAEEIREILDIPGWEFLTLKEAGIESDPEETADSFEGNAMIKAACAHDAFGGAAVADDSGLVVDALGGAPGVYSSRFAGVHGDDAANNALLIEKLQNVPAEKRSARFVSTVVFIDEAGQRFIGRGTVEGHIGYTEQGSNGFGYDPLFYPDEFGGNKTFGQASADEKNAISHRGRALRSLRDKLIEYFKA